MKHLMTYEGIFKSNPMGVEDDKIKKDSKLLTSLKTTIVARNVTIKDIVKREIEKFGYKADLNHIDVSGVTDMKNLFFSGNDDAIIAIFGEKPNPNSIDLTRFNGDISQWNTENVTNMQAMFCQSIFNGDISLWNVGNVTSMDTMFGWLQFNGNISNWDTKNVYYMNSMFCDSQFNGDISNWNVEKVVYMYHMFYRSKFNGDLDKWRVISLGKTFTLEFSTKELFIQSPLEGREPIWYQCLKLGLFKSTESYYYSMDWDWLRSNKTISRFRLEEAIDNYGGDLTKIDQIRGFTFVK